MANGDNKMLDTAIVNLNRKEKLCRKLSIADGVGIELGPLSRPLITKSEGDIRYVDAMTTEQLREQFKDNTFYDINEFVPIDYVWTGRGLADVVGEQRFDYAVASHVIEHVPNVIGWLSDILSILKPNGKIALAVPDMRYTFDVMRKPSTFALMIDNWMRDERRPALQNVFDHFSQVVKVGHDEIVGLFEGRLDPASFERHHDDQQALGLAKESHYGNVYRDCHVYAYTPRSLLEGLRRMISMNLIECRVADFFDTPWISQEFIIVLEKTTGGAQAVAEACRDIDSHLSSLNDTPYAGSKTLQSSEHSLELNEGSTKDGENDELLNQVSTLTIHNEALQSRLSQMETELAQAKSAIGGLRWILNSRRATSQRVMALFLRSWFGRSPPSLE